MIDQNHDIVPTLRMMDGLLFDKAADEIERLRAELERVKVAPVAMAQEPEKLQVWYGPMPETNGKSNFTTIPHKGDFTSGITIDRSEYPDRVRYEADRMRWMIGEIEKEPWILDYDADKHSGYTPPAAQAGAARRKCFLPSS